MNIGLHVKISQIGTIRSVALFAFQMELQFYFLTYEMHVLISNGRSNLIYIWLNDYVNDLYFVPY
jgi:hypothetical protein